MLLVLHQIVIVNLSAFVLAGSHLVLSNTKAESILGTADFAAAQLFLPQKTLRETRRTQGKLLRNLGLPRRYRSTEKR